MIRYSSLRSRWDDDLIFSFQNLDKPTSFKDNVANHHGNLGGRNLIIEFKSCTLHDGALLIMTLYNNIIILVLEKLVYEICYVIIYC